MGLKAIFNLLIGKKIKNGPGKNLTWNWINRCVIVPRKTNKNMPVHTACSHNNHLSQLKFLKKWSSSKE